MSTPRIEALLRELRAELEAAGDTRRVAALIGWFGDVLVEKPTDPTDEIESAASGFGDLVEAARTYLHLLHRQTGQPVCVPDALAYLSAHPDWADRVEQGRLRNANRWTGQIFKGWCRWEKAGHANRGSHRRPAQLWVRRRSVVTSGA